MKILAIETTGPYCSVATINDENDIAVISGNEKMNHLKGVTPMIEAVLDRSGMYLSDLDLIAVSNGPGSYTGIRIGVSTARALSQATGVKLMAVPTLFAFGCQETYEGDEEKIICPLFDARRNQVYAGAYRDLVELVPGGPYMLDEFLGLAADAAGSAEDTVFVFCGDGVLRYGDKIEAWAKENGKKIETREVFQSADGVAEFALNTYSSEKLLDHEQLMPQYMRIPEAEYNRLKKEREQKEAAKENGKKR